MAEMLNARHPEYHIIAEDEGSKVAERLEMSDGVDLYPACGG